MLKTGTTLLAALALALGASDASAQMQWTDKLFVNVNGGYQVISKDVESASSFEVYEEAADLTASQELESGPVFDASAGYRVWKNLAIGVGITTFSSESDVLVNARIPHPLFFDQFRAASVTAPGAKHSEFTTHVQAVWFWPFTDKIDFAFAAGPSFIAVKQELISGVTIGPETGPSYLTPSITDVIVREEKKTAVGFNLGVDTTYMITERYGAGLTLRYVFGSADLPGVTDSVTVGGFHVVGGLRVRLKKLPFME